ncbi:uncharacterized protein LOC107691197 [Sinocyclocheilus anshuiensis]|uniref:uncharacterized protein LOC107691197 n=1 Tax=Sinocyclocheilus anshuiensis TaxID=1608454 RepID=UPI0007BA8AEF|nr:PREDICTED: uncharacterized protein LOC107691197 [Sinocyclocheilus anshuiensis]
MRILQLNLCLLIWCQAAETLTDQLINLGQNVTINCDLTNEVYWFLLKLPFSSVMILRSFSNPIPFYYNASYKQKYSVTSKHLFINNVTTDELGVYFCMSPDGSPHFSNGTRLYIIEPAPPTECQNYTAVQYIQQNHTSMKYIEQKQTSWQTLTLISGLINAVLVIVVIGLLKHAEEDSSMLYTNIHPGPVNSTYVALQLPKP